MSLRSLWGYMRRQVIGRIVEPDPNLRHLRQIEARASAAAAPNELFAVADPTWLWLNTEGYRRSEVLRSILPELPDEATQQRLTGSSGDATLRDAFTMYQLVRRLAEQHLISPLTAVLDFGCGWGRTLRFFLRDLAPANIWGIDCFPAMIDICRQTNRWSHFQLIDPFPPTDLPDRRFDVVYAYSVFSHLGEEAHRQWLGELHRVLVPGGLLVVTTWPRAYILACAGFRETGDTAFYHLGPLQAFPDTDRALRDYDRGDYVHAPVGGGDVLAPSFFGETCIPRDYVLRNWTPAFEFIDYIDDRRQCPQSVIVVKKPR